MKWIVADSLYCAEQFFCSHVDSFSHYLAEAGETVYRTCILSDYTSRVGVQIAPADVLFLLDQYELARTSPAKKKIAMVAAACSPMPWEVTNPDGSPVFSAVVSSLPWMVEASSAAGTPGYFLPLAFDTRARVCGMGVKREAKCIFIGSQGSSHRRRTELLHELRDVVQVLPPVFGRDYFRALAGAKVVLNIHAEWSRGVANNMRLFESVGMGCAVVSDGDTPPGLHETWVRYDGTVDSARTMVMKLLNGGAEVDELIDAVTAMALLRSTYESRIPRLIELARSLP